MNCMRYAQYVPSPALASVVERYWVLEGTDCAEPQPIVPDGRVEIILHFGDRFERHHSGDASSARIPPSSSGRSSRPSGSPARAARASPRSGCGPPPRARSRAARPPR